MTFENLFGFEAKIGIALVVFTLCLKFLLKSPKPQHLTQPPGYPIIGHALDMAPNVFLERMENLVRKHGKFIELYAFAQRFVFISDVALAKEVQAKRPKVFRRPRALDYSAKICELRSGLFTAHSQRWNRIRKITSPSLAKHHIFNSVHKMIAEGLLLTERLSFQADGKTVVEAKYELFLYTLRVISASAFGLTLEGKNAEYMFGQQFPADVASLFQFMIETTTFPLPFWVWRLIPHFYNIEKAAAEGNARFNEVCVSVIAQKRAELAANPASSNHNSVIDILINKESSAQDEEGGEVTDNEILANVKTFFVAGSETTSVTVSWALYFLADNQAVCEEIRAEMKTFYDFYNTSRSVAEVWAALSVESMPITNAVIKETLRLHSPGSINFAQLENTKESYTLSNGLVIHPADLVTIYYDMIHWDEAVFADAKSFNPHRWLTKDTDLLTKMESSFMAFGFGARSCPGMGLAIVEAVIGLCAVVHSFDFKLACDKSEIKRVLMFTSQPSKMPIVLTKRS